MLAMVRREFDALDRLIAGLEPGDWARPVPRPETRDPWTVKDAVAHVLYWKLLTTCHIRGLGRPAEDRGVDGQQINRRVYELWRDRSPDEVMAWHRAVHADAVAALEARPPAWFTRRERGPGWLSDLHSHSAGHRPRAIQPVATD